MNIQPSTPVNRHGITALSLPETTIQPEPAAEQVYAGSPAHNDPNNYPDCLHTLLLQAHAASHLFDILTVLLQSLKVKDAQLYRHSCRVQYLTQSLARVFGLPEDEIMTIGLGALLHDIGKLYIQDQLLQKATRLTALEFAVIKEHPAYGAHILSQFAAFEADIPVVYAHHERWDGAGYPSGLQGEAIPLGARMVAIADAFEVMTSYRVYQAIRTPAEALEELWSCAGTQFDPLLVECFCRNIPLQLPVTINGQSVEPGYPTNPLDQTAF